jgi:CheY-like chemotaxis protein
MFSVFCRLVQCQLSDFQVAIVTRPSSALAIPRTRDKKPQGLRGREICRLQAVQPLEPDPSRVSRDDIVPAVLTVHKTNDGACFRTYLQGFPRSLTFPARRSAGIVLSGAHQARELPLVAQDLASANIGAFMSFRILLVDPDSSAAIASEQPLVHAGFRVAPVRTFEEATRQMSLYCPDLLVTNARLGAFNGLHLLLRCRAEHPDVPVIIVGAPADRTPDMTHFGAEFVTSPIDHGSFLALVATLLSGRTPYSPKSARREPRKRPMLPATVSRQSARAMESKDGELPVDVVDAPDATRRQRCATWPWRCLVDSLN